MIKMTDTLGNVNRFFYDAEGRQTKVVKPKEYNTLLDDGAGVSYEYDAKGNVEMVHLGPDQTKRIIKDANGNITKIINPKQYKTVGIDGSGTSIDYDTLNRPVQIMNAKGSPITRYQYDENNKIIKEFDAVGIRSGDDDETRHGKLYKYNLAGWLIEVKTPLKKENSKIYYNVRNYTYNKKGLVTQEIIGLDYVLENEKPTETLVIQYEYDKVGRVTRITDNTGALVKYSYDVLGRLISQEKKVSDDLYEKLGYSYNDLGKMATTWVELDKKFVINAQENIKAISTYTYDKNGNIKTVTNPKGYVTKYTYDNANRLIKIDEEVDEGTLSQKRNVIKIENPYLEAYSEQSYSYDVNLEMEDNLTEIEAQLSYDPRLIENIEIVSKQPRLDVEVDSLGTLLVRGEVQDKDKKLFSIKFNVRSLVQGTAFFKFDQMPSYSYNNQVNKFTEAIGKSVRVDGPDVSFDGLVQPNDLTLEALEYGIKLPSSTFNYTHDFNPDGEINEKDLDYIKDWLFEKKESKVKLIETDYLNPKLVQLNYSIDSKKVVITTKFVYDKNSNLIKRIDPNNGVIVYTYDQYDRVIQVRDQERNIKSFKYDENGNLIEAIDAEGVKVYYIYDDDNVGIEILDGNKDVIRKNIYNDRGLIAKAIDARGYKSAGTDDERFGTSYHYDIGGRLIDVQTPEQKLKGQKSRYYYNAQSFLKSFEDANGNSTRYKRDRWGRALEITNAENISEVYKYDLTGNIILSKDGNGNSTSYRYTNFGKIAEIVDAKGNKISYTYDSYGQLVEETNRNGDKISYRYDNIGQLIEKRNSQLGDYIKYVYNKDGTLHAGITKNNIKSYSYTPKGLVKDISRNKRRELSYQYNSSGNIVNIVDSVDGITGYSFDEFGRIANVSYNNEPIAEYSYKDHLVKRIIFGNGVAKNYSYNLDGVVSQITANKDDLRYNDYTYMYDGNGYLVSKVENGETTDYVYDKINQLISVQYPTYNEQYEYDNAGNRLKWTKGGDETTYNYNQLNQLESSYNQSVETNYTYDKNGNLIVQATEDKQTQYTYDGFNQLSKVILPNQKWLENEYDAFGLRVNTIETGIVSDFTIDRGLVVVERNETGILKSKEIYGNELLSKYVRTDEYYYYNSERHGDIVNLIDEKGTIANSYKYDVYGNIVDSEEKIFNRYKYAGEQFDSLTGQYYLRARYYNPLIGRFTQEDTYRGAGLNLYQYVGNNPVNYIDPSGHVPAKSASSTAGQDNRIGDSSTSKSSSSAKNSCSKSTIKRLKTTYFNEQDTRFLYSQETFSGVDWSKRILVTTELSKNGEITADKLIQFGIAKNKKYTLWEKIVGVTRTPGEMAELVNLQYRLNKSNESIIKLEYKRYKAENEQVTAALVMSMDQRINAMLNKSVKPYYDTNSKLDMTEKNGVAPPGSKSKMPNPKITKTSKTNQTTGKRIKNKLKPDLNAEGAHTKFKRDPNTGKITNYETYESNPKNPSGFQTKKRYDGTGLPHEIDGEKLLPHVHEYPGKNRVREPYPWEMPQ